MTVKDFLEDKCIVEENPEIVLDYLTNPTYVNPLKMNLQPVQKPVAMDYGYHDPGMSAGMTSTAQQQMQKQQQNSRQQQPYLLQNTQTSTKDDLCKVCFAKNINTVLVPCGHRCMCNDCGKVISNECPICRKPVT